MYWLYSEQEEGLDFFFQSLKNNVSDFGGKFKKMFFSKTRYARNKQIGQTKEFLNSNRTQII